MTVPASGCARDDCCERQSAGGESEAIGERVVKDVLEALLVPLMSKGRPGSFATEDVPAVATLVTEALTVAAPGVTFCLAVHGDHYGSGATATSRVGAQLPRRWEPYKGYEPDDQPDTIDVAVGDGLCVVAGPRRTWIVHSPAVRSAVRP